MRILHLVQDPGIAPGKKKGASVHVEAMRAAFARLGHDVVGLDEADPARAIERFLEAHARAPFDLVYERYALGRAALALRAAQIGVPHAFEVNAPLAEEEVLWRAGAKADEEAQERLAFAASAAVLCVSSDCVRYAIARGAREAAAYVEPNGVDGELFTPLAKDDARRRALVPDGRFGIGFHGRLRPWHNFALFAEAAQDLLVRGVPVQLVLLGEGDFDAELAGRVPARHIARLPWVEHKDVPAVVGACDVLPLTYSPDAPCWFSPLKLLEAMSCGVVPVVPAMGDLEDAVAHERDGLVYRAGDRSGLVAALERLWRDETLRTRLAAAARLRAGAHSWTRIAERLLERIPAARRREAV